ncbi:hypothetical protein Forpi1262_v015553 [Fusarium oxysporum f. sp. raphani]|uniref:DDE-1 domain-containing protein n=1 Tax=Fusarium oxysporum f. sp. raphani TaxID=96318 RepID=A0A8J5PRI0_FUSOX|nr:hypothetical protein Forpi1262_v015553 [Fusarium oxysporum f. sp. raphani]
MKPSRVIDAARKRCVTKETLTEYYDGLSYVIESKNITRQYSYNIDETGVQLGETNGGTVAGTVMTSSSERIKSDNSTWSSILESISADGRRLTPTVIFTSENLQGQWFPGIFPDWKYTTSPTGWSNADIFLKWFMESWTSIKASRKALTRRNILSGFLATGLFPIDVRKALKSLKPKEKKRKSFEGPITPRKRQVVAETVWGTPQGSHDIEKQLQEAQKNGNPSIRDFNCILKKAMKSIEQKNSQIQRLEEEKAVLKASAAAKAPTDYHSTRSSREEYITSGRGKQA